MSRGDQTKHRVLVSSSTHLKLFPLNPKDSLNRARAQRLSNTWRSSGDFTTHYLHDPTHKHQVVIAGVQVSYCGQNHIPNARNYNDPSVIMLVNSFGHYPRRQGNDDYDA